MSGYPNGQNAVGRARTVTPGSLGAGTWGRHLGYLVKRITDIFSSGGLRHPELQTPMLHPEPVILDRPSCPGPIQAWPNKTGIYVRPFGLQIGTPQGVYMKVPFLFVSNVKRLRSLGLGHK